MPRRSTAIQAGVRTCLFLMALSHATEPAHAGDAALPSPPPSDSGEPAEDEEDELRQRLTEREDKRRPAEPWSIELAGRPFTISGEYEIHLGYVRRRASVRSPHSSRSSLAALAHVDVLEDRVLEPRAEEHGQGIARRADHGLTAAVQRGVDDDR
jgi:hypothetical protein